MSDVEISQCATCGYHRTSTAFWSRCPACGGLRITRSRDRGAIEPRWIQVIGLAMLGGAAAGAWVSPGGFPFTASIWNWAAGCLLLAGMVLLVLRSAHPVFQAFKWSSLVLVVLFLVAPPVPAVWIWGLVPLLYLYGVVVSLGISLLAHLRGWQRADALVVGVDAA